MKRSAAVLLAIVGLAALAALPMSAQEVSHPRIVGDEKWCRLMLPGKTMAAARQRCVEFLGSTLAISSAYAAGEGDLAQPGKDYALPNTLIGALVFNGAVSIGISEGKAYVEWSEVPPDPFAPTPPSPVSLPTPPSPVIAPTPPSPVSSPTPPSP